MTPDPERDKGKIVVYPSHLHGEAGWVAWEDPQVCPFYPVRKHALSYAIWRGENGLRPLEVRDAEGKVLRAIQGDALRALARKRNDEAIDAWQRFVEKNDPWHRNA